MVIRAEKDFERFSLSKNAFTALPISVYESADGVITYTAYKKLIRKVKAFEKSNTSAFCEVGMSQLYKIAEPLMRSHALKARNEENIILEYATYKALPQSEHKTVIIKTNKELSEYNTTTTLWRLEIDDDCTADVICAVIADGQIAAFAGINDIAENSTYEINVECGIQYRRRGYAVACTRDLCKYLFEKAAAKCVTYRCRAENIASAKTAERAGFSYVGRSMTLVYDR